MNSETEIHVYFMPGMSANSLIFERIKLPQGFVSHFLEWIPPKKDEKIANYSKRLSKLIVHENPILIGVSFGGLIVQELSKIINTRKVFIISSIKTNKESSVSMKFAKKTKSYKLLPLLVLCITTPLFNAALHVFWNGGIKTHELARARMHKTEGFGMQGLPRQGLKCVVYKLLVFRKSGAF